MHNLMKFTLAIAVVMLFQPSDASHPYNDQYDNEPPLHRLRALLEQLQIRTSEDNHSEEVDFERRDTGVVKWFSKNYGFGIIAPDDGDDDLLVFASQLRLSGIRTLREGQKVQFEVISDPQGKQASNIDFL